MGNPLTKTAPDSTMKRVHDLAFDLAWGADNEIWENCFLVSRAPSGEQWHLFFKIDLSERDSLQDRINEKWGDKSPPIQRLAIEGFLTLEEGTHTSSSATYCLTSQAFKLLG